MLSVASAPVIYAAYNRKGLLDSPQLAKTPEGDIAGHTFAFVVCMTSTAISVTMPHDDAAQKLITSTLTDSYH